ncbi:MAG: glycosyltransferase [Candidatus Omnitrophota bacterium]
MDTNDRFSLVIPTYNEAENIGELCCRLVDILSKIHLNFEIIIVDDNSIDGTDKIVQEFSVQERRIKLIRRIKEKGLGTAVIAGWSNADGNILGVIDGDLQHPPEILPAMIGKLQENKRIDIVVASRNVKGGGVSQWSLIRRFISWLGALSSSFFLPGLLSLVKDPMSGFFLLRKEVIKDKTLTPLGYKILLEVLAKGDYRLVKEIPYYFQERKKGGSKAGLKQYLTSFVHIIKLSIQKGEIFRVLGYIGVGIIGSIVTFAVYLFCIGLKIANLASYAIGLELAIINNFILNEVWIFKDKARLLGGIKTFSIRLIKFNFICLDGAVISFLTFFILFKFANIGLIYAALSGISVSFLWNFIVSTNLVWPYEYKDSTYVEPGYYHNVIAENRIQGYWHKKKFEIISANLSSAPFLDIGSGPGVFFYQSANLSGLKINLDFSFEQLKYGKTLNSFDTFIQAEASLLPFADNSFSTIYFIETIEHLRQEEARLALREIWRVLKEDGKLIISTPNYRSIWPVIEFFISVIGPIDYLTQHINHFNVGKLTKFLVMHNFTVRERKTFFIISPFFAIISSKFSDFLFKLEQKVLPQMGGILLVEAIKKS